MEVNYRKGITNGLISLGIYVALPLILITILSSLNILHFSSSFTILLLIFGIIRVFIAFVKNIYPKETFHHNFIGMCAALYSGLYLFYIFGGFSPNLAFGDYYVATENLSALFGLQFIAWLMLLAAILNTVHYSLKCIDIRKQNALRKENLFRTILKRGSLILYLVLAGFLLSIIFSGLNVSFPVKENYTYIWDTNSTPFYDDDRIDVTVYFDVLNNGLYPIQDIILNAEIYTVNTSDVTQLMLPDNRKIGEIKNVHYPQFPAFTLIINANLTIGIIPTYVPGLITYDAVLKFQIFLSFSYAGIYVNLNTSILTTWTALV
ncbi:MAG: hypothetical protein ACTSRS_16775 [Candidatus Helarchaeota archaeon]